MSERILKKSLNEKLSQSSISINESEIKLKNNNINNNTNILSISTIINKEISN